MLINEIAKLCDTTIDTLRYYDKIGLLVPKRNNNRRMYSVEDIEKLKSIITMKNMMFTLDEIKTILSLDALIDTQLEKNQIDIHACKLLLTELKEKYQTVLKQEEDIKKIKKQLNHFMEKVEEVIGEKEEKC